MHIYLRQLRAILEHGQWKEQRAVKADGTKLMTKHIFGMQARYNLQAGFPLVTTKNVNFRIIAEELRWFLSGSTNNNDLLKANVKIWNEWADPETGDLGPIYGKQWRAWDGPDGKTTDQIQYILNSLESLKKDPNHSCGRRMILSAWNPVDIPKMKGPFACHTMSHFNLHNGMLSCHMFQRSADMFLGVPYNIASYALLTHLLARVSNVGVGELVHTISDAHIYENHIEQVTEQLQRVPNVLPLLFINEKITKIDEWTVNDMILSGYCPHPKLNGEVAI